MVPIFESDSFGYYDSSQSQTAGLQQQPGLQSWYTPGGGTTGGDGGGYQYGTALSKLGMPLHLT